MLKQNGYIHNQLPLRFMGGGTISGNRANFGRGDRLNWFCGDNVTDNKGGFPYGYRAPGAWLLGLKQGALSSYGSLAGTGAVSPLTMAGGINGTATLSGSGDITSAFAGLIVSAVATLVGSGSISSADAKAFLNALATISGSGGVSSATLNGLGTLAANVLGYGTVSNATQYATGTLSATIRGYADLTPEGIRDKVWDALAANFDTSGTMGALLNSAGSGGVDLNALADAIVAALKADPSTLTVGKFLGLK